MEKSLMLTLQGISLALRCVLPERDPRETAPLFQDAAVTATRQTLPPPPRTPTQTEGPPDNRYDFGLEVGKRPSLPALQIGTGKCESALTKGQACFVYCVCCLKAVLFEDTG
ncbi:hypothetical protein FKM82_027231 [Ascaphus truei]